MTLLRHHGACVPDAQDCHEIASPATRYYETQRAVADYVELGAWCDALAWSAVFTEDERLATGALALSLLRQQQRARRR